MNWFTQNLRETKGTYQMSFVLSERSLLRLAGVKDKLSKAVQSAIDYTKVDFGVTCGLRTIEEQKELVESGASQTMNSKHLDGNAVDLVAYVGPKICWELNVYDDVAEAMKTAAMEHDLSIRWGAAWHIDDIREWNGNIK